MQETGEKLPEIHRCPCDYLPAHFRVIEGHYITCMGCGLRGPCRPTNKEAVEAWNLFASAPAMLNLCISVAEQGSMKKLPVNLFSKILDTVNRLAGVSLKEYDNG